METISSNNAPKAIGPYSQAIRTGYTLYTSGQIGIDPATGKLAGSNIETQTLQVIKNLSEILKSAGLSINSIVKTTVFLANMKDFPKMNSIYSDVFINANKPARSTVQVSCLPLNALVEIDCIAVYE